MRSSVNAMLAAATILGASGHGPFLDSEPPRKGPPQKIPPRRVKAGRNDPCPCGSGRKSKKCCRNKTTLPV